MNVSKSLYFKREMTRHPVGFNPKLHPSKEYKFDGQGGFKPNSGAIPLKAIPAVIVVATVFAAMIFVGAAVGF